MQIKREASALQHKPIIMEAASVSHASAVISRLCRWRRQTR